MNIHFLPWSGFHTLSITSTVFIKLLSVITHVYSLLQRPCLSVANEFILDSMSFDFNLTTWSAIYCPLPRVNSMRPFEEVDVTLILCFHWFSTPGQGLCIFTPGPLLDNCRRIYYCARPPIWGTVGYILSPDAYNYRGCNNVPLRSAACRRQCAGPTAALPPPPCI